jgi:C-terminal processing protease CtpA/Prc
VRNSNAIWIVLSVLLLAGAAQAQSKVVRATEMGPSGWSVGAQQLYAPVRIVGIGVALEQRADGTIQVNAVIPNAPSEKAGMAPGDEILEVQSRPGLPAVEVRLLPLADVVALIRGPIGVRPLLLKRSSSRERRWALVL